MKWLDKLKGKSAEPPEPFEPATESQGNYVIMMYRDFSEWQFNDKEAKRRCESAFQSMHRMIDPFINTDDYYDRSAWTLSKKQASKIISAFEPEYRWLEGQD